MYIICFTLCKTWLISAAYASRAARTTIPLRSQLRDSKVHRYSVFLYKDASSEWTPKACIIKNRFICNVSLAILNEVEETIIECPCWSRYTHRLDKLPISLALDLRERVISLVCTNGIVYTHGDKSCLILTENYFSSLHAAKMRPYW